MPYDAMRHRSGVREVLAKNDWEARYIEGQLAGLDVLSRAIRYLGRAVGFASPKRSTA